MAGSKHHYVYRSYEPLGKSYIGKRTCLCPPEEDTTYFGSYSDPGFHPTQKEILAVCESSEHALSVEIFFHEFYDVARNPMFANRAKQTSVGFSTEGVSPSPETRLKLSQATKGRPQPKEHSEKISIGLKGKKKSDSHRKKLSLSKKGKPVSENCRAAQLKAVKGIPKTLEHRQKIRIASTGKTQGPEARKKMAQKRTENNLGRSWWVNPEGETKFQKESPGDNWIKGRTYK
jgi:hypothetical protein